MLQIIREPIGQEEVKNLALEIGGYIKIVADLERNILAAGARMHVDEEQALLDDGSERENLWGGGYGPDDNGFYFDSIINLRPGVNESNEILDEEMRRKFVEITRRLFSL